MKSAMPRPVNEPLKIGRAIFVESGNGVVLDADEVESERHLMPAANQVDVVGHLEIR